MEIVRVDKQSWEKYAADAHMAVFEEKRPAEFNRIDYALMCVDSGVPQTYATLRELDEETVYIQYGGSFPSAMGSLRSFRSYEMTIIELSHFYKRATTLIENKNKTMLKFASRIGFEIIGVRTFEGKIYLEHLIEFARHDG